MSHLFEVIQCLVCSLNHREHQTMERLPTGSSPLGFLITASPESVRESLESVLYLGARCAKTVISMSAEAPVASYMT